MAYCTQTDIVEQISETELVQLTDDAGNGVVDTSVVDRAIADADAEIDGYCEARYSVPFTTATAQVRKLSVDIAVYNLFSRRAGAPESRVKRYDDAIAFLTRVADGKATLPGVSGAASESASDRVDLSGSDRVFSRDNLVGW